MIIFELHCGEWRDNFIIKSIQCHRTYVSSIELRKKRRSFLPGRLSFRRWSMLGLMAAGEVDSFQLRRGAEYLMRTQQADGLWKDEWFNAPGIPRVFYLKYHGYAKYFPLWALARYRNLRE